MTITPSLSAQSYGTSTNVGNGKFATKVTLAAGTTAAQLEMRLVNGAAGYDRRQAVKLHFAFSGFDMTAAAAYAALGQSSRFLEVFPSADALVTQVKISLLEPAPGGGFLYFWVDAPNLTVASAVSVNVIEYP